MEKEGARAHYVVNEMRKESSDLEIGTSLHVGFAVTRSRAVHVSFFSIMSNIPVENSPGPTTLYKVCSRIN